MPKVRFLSPLLFLLLLARTASAQQDVAEGSPIRLGAPLVQTLGMDTRSPCAIDLDVDGRMDLAVINNGEARIDLLYQRTPEELREEARTRIEREYWNPILDTAPFLPEKILVGDRLYAIAGLDFDADGIPDLAFTGKRTPLSLRFGDGKGGWDDGWTFDGTIANPASDALAVADVNGDKIADLVMLGNSELYVFLGGKTRGPARPEIYRVGADGARGLKVADLDGDSILDISYLQPSEEKAIIVRLGLPAGGFGAELDIPRASGADSWALTGPTSEEGAKPNLVTIRPTWSEIDIGPLKVEDKSVHSATALQAQNYPVPRSGSSAALPAVGDFDGDSFADVAMADPDGARILIWFGSETGHFRRPVEFPALSEATSLSSVTNGEGKRDSLLMCSEEEGFVGLSTLEENGRMPFPQPLEVEGEPLLAAGADLDADGIDEIVVAVKDGLRLEAAVLKRAGDGWEPQESAKLGSIKRNPSHIVSADLDAKPGDDLVLFIPREPAHLLLANGEGGLEIAAEDSSIRNGQFSDIEPSGFGTGDFDGDGNTDIMLAKQGFVRVFRIRDGKLEVVDQGNARQGADRIYGPVLVPGQGEEPSRLVFYDPKNEAVQLLQKEDDGTFRYLRSLAVSPIDLTGARLAPGTDSPQLMVFGTDRFWVLPLGGEAWRADSQVKFRTKIEDVGFDTLATGDLGGSSAPELIAIDGDQNVLEILTPDSEGGGYTSALHFKVFERSPFFRGGDGDGREPHAVLVGDFDGNEGGDLILLCHDRLLLYPGIKP